MKAIAIDKARRLDIYTRKNGTFKKKFIVKNAEDGTPYSFAGHMVAMEIFNKLFSNPDMIIDEDSFMTVTDGEIDIAVPDTEMDFRKNDLYYRMWVVNDEGKFVWLNGKFVVNNFNLFDGVNTTTGTTMTTGDNNVIIYVGGNGNGPTPGTASWGTLQGNPSDSDELTEYINELIEQAGGGGPGPSDPNTYNGGVIKEGTNVRWGGTPIAVDTFIAANGRGIQFGQDGSALAFFNLVGANYEANIDASLMRFQHNNGFGFEGDGSGKFYLKDLDGMIIGGDELDGSALLQLVSQTRALSLTNILALSGIAVPRDGMVTYSAELKDVVARINNAWVPLTRPIPIITADVDITLNDEEHRGACIIMTGNGQKYIRIPQTGLSEGFICFVMKKQSSTGTIRFVPMGSATLDAFDDEIHVGGASLYQPVVGEAYASGSLGEFVDSNAVYAAIDAAEDAAKDYADDLFDSVVKTEHFAVSNEATALTTGDAKITFRMPQGMTLTKVKGSLTTAQTAGSLLTIRVNKNGTTIFSTNLTFDNNETTTESAATPAVISTPVLLADDVITVDIVTVGTSGAAGLKLAFIGT